MNAGWASLPPRAKTSLLSAIRNKAPEFIPEALSKTLWGLADMELKWDRFGAFDEVMDQSTGDINRPTSISKSISTSAVSTASAASAITGMGSSRGRVSSLRGALISSLNGLCDQYDSQSLSMCFSALGKLNCDYETSAEPFRVSLYRACIRCAKADQFKPVEVANLVYGLGKMNARYHLIPEPMRDVIVGLVEKNCGSMTEQELGNAVWALCCPMGLSFSTMPLSLRDALRRAIEG
jgi:hypothetical protein